MNGNKKIVHFLSASDRLNYGDLLFPILFKKIIERNKVAVDFYNYGIVKSDFSSFGALPTKSFKKLLKNSAHKKNNIIIGGGEVFFANWDTLYNFISARYSFLCKYVFVKRAMLKLEIAKNILSNGRVNIPFVPSKNEYKNESLNIIYNSVGGNFSNEPYNEKNIKIADSLKQSKHLSVRDLRTKKSLLKFGVNSVLTPDSALIMSDLFSTSEIDSKSLINKNLIPEKYIFLQIGINKQPISLNDFTGRISKIAKELDLKILVCPIGLAPNHEDQKVLKRIKTLNSEVHYIHPNNLYDIMYLISNSNCYIGTSLHGMITAQSFNIPFMPLNKKVVKMDNYCKTWTNEVCEGCIDYNKIEDIIDKYLNWNYSKLVKITNHQKALVYKNFECIFEKLI